MFGMGWVPVGDFKAHRRASSTTTRKVTLVTSYTYTTGYTMRIPASKAPERATRQAITASNPSTRQGLSAISSKQGEMS